MSDVDINIRNTNTVLIDLHLYEELQEDRSKAHSRIAQLLEFIEDSGLKAPKEK